MKTQLSILLISVSLLTFSQKWDTIPPVKHNHALAFEFGGGAGFNWAVGYEYWYRNGIHGFGTSIGLGVKGYRRNGGSGNLGEVYNGHMGIHYTVGKWMGLRIGINIAGEINPKAFTGYYNTGGVVQEYPIENEWIVPGDAVLMWRTYINFDIGPYFTLLNGEFYLYPKFSLGIIWNEHYFYHPPRVYQFLIPYGGLTIKFDIAKIHSRFVKRRNIKKVPN